MRSEWRRPRLQTPPPCRRRRHRAWGDQHKGVPSAFKDLESLHVPLLPADGEEYPPSSEPSAASPVVHKLAPCRGSARMLAPSRCLRPGAEASSGSPPRAPRPPLDDGSGRTPGGGSGTLGKARRDERSPAPRRTRRDRRARVAGRIVGKATGEGCSEPYARRYGAGRSRSIGRSGHDRTVDGGSWKGESGMVLRSPRGGAERLTRSERARVPRWTCRRRGGSGR